MGIKAEIHTSAYEGSVVSGSLVIAALTTFLGPVGTLIGLGYTAASLIRSNKRANEVMDKIITEKDEKIILEHFAEQLKHSKKKKLEIEIKSHDTANNSTLSKLLFGNDITKTYYYTKND